MFIEDDYDSEFRYDGPPIAALAGLNRNSSVIYLGTFSKSIGSGHGTGFLVVPKQLIEPMLGQPKSLANYGHPWLEQIVLAEFIARGGFARHLRRNSSRLWAIAVGAVGESEGAFRSDRNIQRKQACMSCGRCHLIFPARTKW